MNRDRSKSETLIKNVAASRKFGAIVVTVDAHAPGKREADERVKAEGVLVRFVVIVNNLEPR